MIRVSYPSLTEHSGGREEGLYGHGHIDDEVFWIVLLWCVEVLGCMGKCFCGVQVKLEENKEKFGINSDRPLN